jgi:hypothetical protein
MDHACQKGGPSTTMMNMRVLVDKLLRQDSRGWSPVFENLSVQSVWVGGYAPSCPALNGASPQKPSHHSACPVPKGPQVMRRGPYGQVVGFCSFMAMGVSQYRSFLC